MCIKNVNAIVNCFGSIQLNDNNNITKYINPFDCIYAQVDNGRPYIGPFVIETTINILGTNNIEKKSENPLEKKITLDFKIRLAKCDPDEKKQVDLETFTINLLDDIKKHEAYFPYVYNRVLQIGRMYLDPLEGKGKYMIKVLMKSHNEPDSAYSIQSMTKLEIL